MVGDQRGGGWPRFWPVSAGVRQWLSVASRVVAAVPGGYALTMLSVAACSTLYGDARAYGILTFTLASFAIYTIAIIWVFAARDAWRAWAGLCAAALILGLVWLYGAWFVK